jgi:hypothetical protein
MADERPPLQELELRVKEQELKLKETEIRAKEREINASRWVNPLVIGLFAAALGLAGNVIVTIFNNQSTQKVERERAQSTLILEAIKTNGDTNASCKNLIFFVSLGLLEDENHTITGACPGNVQGVPSISFGPRVPGPPDALGGTFFYPLSVQTVDNDGAPISDVSVEANLVSPIQIDESFFPWISSDENYKWIVRHTDSRCTSGKDGNCYLHMAPAGKFIAIVAKKDGYAGDRATILFTGNTVVVELQKNPGNH